MRILFLETHPMWIYGLPNGFRRLGHRVKTCAPDGGAKRIIDRFKPELIFTVGWTPANGTPKSQLRIAKLVRRSGVPHVHWSTEDPGYTDNFSLPLIRRTKPDFVFTIHRPTVKLFKKHSIQAAHLDFGSDPSVHRRMKPSRQYKGKAAIIANGYLRLYRKNPQNYRFRSIRRLVNPFLRKGIQVDFYGREWNKMSHILARPVDSKRIHGYLPYTKAAKVYSSVDFVIGPQNAKDRLTQRTYEILGSGGLLITDDTPEVRKWFRPGKDLLVSLSEKETKRLIEKYSKSPAERERIRRNAVLAVKRHSYANRARYVLGILEKAGVIRKGRRQL